MLAEISSLGRTTLGSSKGVALLMEMSEKRCFRGNNSEARAAIFLENWEHIRVKGKTLSRGRVSCAPRKGPLPSPEIVVPPLAQLAGAPESI